MFLNIKLYVKFSFVILFVIGCSTNKGGYKNADEVSNRLVGMTISELVSIMGAPTNSIDLGEGGKSITFEGFTGGPTGGTCRISLVVKGGIVTSANVFSSDRSFISFPMGGCESLIKQLK
tara:strand:- start:955 stop:1314 length:360 start_codon:yes stop_codon:yes gene_type:complete